MASGNDGDPPRAHGRRGSNGRRLSQKVNSEDQVAKETEEVFRSYAFYRYQQETTERGEEVPMDPEIVEIQQKPGSTGNLVGRRLAIIGDDINKRYDAEFRCMLKSLQPTKENAYEHFTRIASSYASYLIWNDLGGCSSKAIVPLGLYGAQLALNWAWPPFFFGAHNLKMALIDILCLDGLVIGMMCSWYRINKIATLLMVPYLGWLAMATCLTIRIWKDNPEQKPGKSE